MKAIAPEATYYRTVVSLMGLSPGESMLQKMTVQRHAPIRSWEYIDVGVTCVVSMYVYSDTVYCSQPEIIHV